MRDSDIKLLLIKSIVEEQSSGIFDNDDFPFTVACIWDLSKKNTLIVKVHFTGRKYTEEDFFVVSDIVENGSRILLDKINRKMEDVKFIIQDTFSTRSINDEILGFIYIELQIQKG